MEISGRGVASRLSPGAVRHWSIRALGGLLLLLVAMAWVTSIPYLLTRLQLPALVSTAVVDGLHIYVGVVGGVIVLFKVARIGLRRRVPGMPNVVLWQRWLSWFMLASYAGIFVTGVLALLPLPEVLRRDVIDAHLMSSVWALPPTTWHAWHYRSLLGSLLRRLNQRAGQRWLTAILIMLIPLVALGAFPRSVSQLSQAGAGQPWRRAGLDGVFLDRISVTPDGRELVAAGIQVHTSRDGLHWQTVDLPATSAPGEPPSPVIRLDFGSDGSTYVANAGGEFVARRPEGPYEPMAMPGRFPRLLALDPRRPGTMWGSAFEGPEVTTDGGRTWASYPAGLASPHAVTAMAFWRGTVYLSDTTAVYRWQPTDQTWVVDSPQTYVLDLQAAPDGSALYSGSSVSGVSVLDGTGWHSLQLPPSSHHGGGAHSHAEGLVWVEGRLYAVAALNGVAVSSDRRSWVALGDGLDESEVTQLTAFQGDLWASTNRGLYRRPTPIPPPSPTWWWSLLVVAFACGLVGGLWAAQSGWARPKSPPAEDGAHPVQPESAARPGRSGLPVD